VNEPDDTGIAGTPGVPGVVGPTVDAIGARRPR
jgi:hypothetical protein